MKVIFKHEKFQDLISRNKQFNFFSVQPFVCENLGPRPEVGEHIDFFFLGDLGSSRFATANVSLIDDVKIQAENDKFIIMASSDIERPILLSVTDKNFTAQLAGFDDWSDLKGYIKEDFEGLRIWFENLKVI